MVFGGTDAPYMQLLLKAQFALNHQKFFNDWDHKSLAIVAYRWHGINDDADRNSSYLDSFAQQISFNHLIASARMLTDMQPAGLDSLAGNGGFLSIKPKQVRGLLLVAHGAPTDLMVLMTSIPKETLFKNQFM